MGVVTPLLYFDVDTVQFGVLGAPAGVTQEGSYQQEF